MKDFKIDFYNSTNLKSYNLNESMRYQLSVLDSLDVFTRLHSENVANLTCRICEQLHMKSYFIVYCTICAYLHDIGKQFIPPAVLQKNGKLTEEEYSIMKSHTTIGHQICMKDEKLRDYANGALYHHEALNGSGYPQGVSDKDIPLEGKIIRVADEFDAITSKRQYKTHIGVYDTLEILKEEVSLNKINPKILKALIKVVLEDTEYELYNLSLYVDYLKENMKRLEQIKIYKEKMENSSKEKDIEYYKQGIIQLFAQGENIENYLQVLSEYEQAYLSKKSHLEELQNEIKKIKKMKV